jgi:glucosamine-phosphate N-acetyltransferase
MSQNVLMQFYRMASNEAYHVFVAKPNLCDVIIGCSSLFIERKLSYGGCQVGHIQDVCVIPEARSNGAASVLIRHCINVAKKKNCRKILLECKRELVPFYERFGFSENETSMRLNIDG